MMKKKILHIIEEFRGGSFVFLQDLCNGLSDEFDIVVAFCRDKDTPSDLTGYFNNKIVCYKIKYRPGIGIFRDICSFFELRKVLRTVKPDIVHLHGAAAGYMGKMVADAAKMKVLYSPHGDAEKKITGAIKKRVVAYLLTRASAEKVMTVADTRMEHVGSLLRGRRSVLARYGVNIDKIPQAQVHRVRLYNLRIGTMGKLELEKNPYLFSEVATGFTELRFVWIGDGAARSELFCKNIAVTGWMPRNEALRWLSGLDIFIMTSAHDHIPTSLLEAMYYGKVCIVRNIPAFRDIIRDGKSGFLAESRDDFVSIIASIKSGAVDMNEIGTAARQEVISTYNAVEMSDSYRRVYLGADYQKTDGILAERGQDHTRIKKNF